MDKRTLAGRSVAPIGLGCMNLSWAYGDPPPHADKIRLLERAMAKVLSGPLGGGALEFMDGRRLGIEVSDLGLRWVVELQGERLVVVDTPAEATVRGTSFAAPLVAGRLALRYPAPAVDRIGPAVAALVMEAHDLGKRGRDEIYGHGLICGDCGGR